jgi:sodium/potassium-transporting ATPase subunit alpha
MLPEEENTLIPSEDDQQVEVKLENERTLTIFHSSKIIGVEPAEEKAAPAAKRVDAGKLDLKEHLWSLEELGTHYSTSFDANSPEESKGLSSEEARKRLQDNGPNRLTPPKTTPLWIQYLKQYENPLTSLLMLAGLLSLILYAVDSENDSNLYLGVILIGVTILNSLIEFVQAQRGQKILESFKNLIPTNSFVYRDGIGSELPAIDLVVGDVVQLREGDKVPADVRLFWCHHLLKVDNSSLTGESEPQKRTVESRHESPLEADNVAFSGTTINSGHGFGVVIRCGDHTTLGQIANLAGGGDIFEDEKLKKKEKSPLQEEIESFVKIIAIWSVVMALVFFGIGMAINPDFSRNFSFLVGILVANIPQGLPSTVTLLLTYAVQKLSKENVLVKDLQGIDTLGSITLLASDKTGTMTQNRMTVVKVWVQRTLFSTHESSLRPGITQFDASSFVGSLVLKICSLCSRARFELSPENLALPIEQRKVNGDATETGLLRYAASHADVNELHKTFPVVFELPFTTHTKWALTIHSLSASENPEHSYLVLMKGAPERVLAKCSKFRESDSEVGKTDEHEKAFEEAYHRMASSGERVLSMSYLFLKRSDFPENFAFEYDEGRSNFPLDQLCFLGLIGLMDPPKPGVSGAIEKCKTAGIKVMMLTGDVRS